MTLRKFLLPPNLDQPEQNAELRKLVRQHGRRGVVTTGWIEDVYPKCGEWKGD
jgi:hypothetical protein